MGEYRAGTVWLSVDEYRHWWRMRDHRPQRIARMVDAASPRPQYGDGVVPGVSRGEAADQRW